MIGNVLFLTSLPYREKDLGFVVTGRIVAVLLVFLLALPLCLAWRLVGGRAPGRVVVTLFYQAGILYLGCYLVLMAIGVAIGLQDSEFVDKALAVLRSAQIGTEEKLQRSMRLGEGVQGPETAVAAAVTLPLMAALPVWGLISWGAHRRALSLSCWRSAVALGLFAILTGLPVALIAWLADWL